MLRFVSRIKWSGKNDKEIQDGVWPELKLAKVYRIHTIQAKSFEREMQYLLSRSTQIDQFKFFIDKDKVIRSQGRIGLANLPTYSQ